MRHQLVLYQQGGRRPQLRPADRLLWTWLSRVWSGWQAALVIVQPRTVISWQRKRFRDHWTRLSRQGKVGRRPVSTEVRDLIRKISRANRGWDSPRIVGELAKLGFEVAKSTVDKYRVRVPKPPSPTWRAFLANHAKDLVSVDFFTVATLRFASSVPGTYRSALPNVGPPRAHRARRERRRRAYRFALYLRRAHRGIVTGEAAI